MKNKINNTLNYYNIILTLHLRYFLVLLVFIQSCTAFGFFFCYSLDDIMECVNDFSHVYCNNASSNTNSTSNLQSFDNPQSNIPGGNNNPNHSVIPDTNSSNEDDREELLRKSMADKLSRHRISCADKAVYDTKLDDKFTPQEHEYICDKVMEHKRNNPNTHI